VGDIKKFFGDKVAAAVTRLNPSEEENIKKQLNKYPKLKLLTSRVIKEYLIYKGIPESRFLNLDKVESVDLPFLGDRLESFIFFPNGVLITGNLFGSYHSKEVLYLDNVLVNHLRLFHRANITSTERLKHALEILEPYKGAVSYILPNYGYIIDSTALNYVWSLLSKLEISTDFSLLVDNWEELARGYGIKATDYKNFLQLLENQNHSLLFTIIDAMDTLNIVPVEF